MQDSLSVDIVSEQWKPDDIGNLYFRGVQLIDGIWKGPLGGRFHEAR